MSNENVLRLGWIGLGSMGLPMAKNLQAYLTAKNAPAIACTSRTMSSCDPLKAVGGFTFKSIAEVVQYSDIIFASLPNDAALSSVISEIMATGNLKGKTIVDTSTVYPQTQVDAASDLASVGALFVAAPVFGGPTLAEQGQLLVAVAGPTTVTSVITPIFQSSLARNVIQLGDDILQAGLLKTTGNALSAGMAEMISEAHVFAEKAGLPTQVLDSLIQENFGAYAHSISQKIVTGLYAPPTNEKPKSSINLAVKDIQHGITFAESVGTRLELSNLALSHLKEAQKFTENRENRELDSSAMYGALRERAGLDFETAYIKKRDA